jgi:hypothetical protein
MWGNQGNMHVHLSNTLINILRFFETHILTCYRPTMKQIVWGSFERPRDRACSRTYLCCECGLAIIFKICTACLLVKLVTLNQIIDILMPGEYQI